MKNDDNAYRRAKKEYERLGKTVFTQTDDSPEAVIRCAVSLIKGIEASDILRETIFKIAFWQVSDKERTMSYHLVPGKELIAALHKYGQGDGYRFVFELAELN